MQPNRAGGGVGPIQKAQSAAGLLVFLAQVFASPLEVCLRRGFGTKYLGFQALGSLFAVGLWASIWPGADARPVVWFWWYVVLMFIRAKRESGRMAAKGVSVHTRYNGYPRLAALFKRMPETKVKGKVEPAVSLREACSSCARSRSGWCRARSMQWTRQRRRNSMTRSSSSSLSRSGSARCSAIGVSERE
jgi:hypothetical protein